MSSATSMLPNAPALKDDWDEKHRGLDLLVEKLFNVLEDHMPKQTTEALQDRVKELPFWRMST